MADSVKELMKEDIIHLKRAVKSGIQAESELVESNLRLVVYFAKKQSRVLVFEFLDDFIQQGNNSTP